MISLILGEFIVSEKHLNQHFVENRNSERKSSSGKVTLSKLQMQLAYQEFQKQKNVRHGLIISDCGIHKKIKKSEAIGKLNILPGRG